MKHYSADLPVVEKTIYNVPVGTVLPIRGMNGQLFFLQYAPRPGLYVWDNDMWCRVCVFNSIILEQTLNSLMRVMKITSSSNLTADDCGVILCDTENSDIDIVLPPTALCAGLRFEFKNTRSAGVVRVTGVNDEETIDGINGYIVVDQPYGSLIVYTDGREWFILGK